MPLRSRDRDAVTPPEKLPLAPLAGAVKITEIDGTPLPKASLTLACKEAGNAEFTGADLSRSSGGADRDAAGGGSTARSARRRAKHFRYP